MAASQAHEHRDVVYLDATSFPAGSCRAPGRRPGLVRRDGLIGPLVERRDDLVVITAPAGFGKTTTVALWDDADQRHFAWVNLDVVDDDPVHLLRHVGCALDVVQPLAPTVRRVLDGPGRSPEQEMLPALGAEMAGREPFVLVFDDVHVVQRGHSRTCLEQLVDIVPPGSSVALVGRTAPRLRIPRRRMTGGLAELDATGLALSATEATRLFEAMGIELDQTVVERLVERTEGWAGGLHLAALGLGNRPPGEPAMLTGRDRLVADYLIEEVLAALDTDTVDFLQRSAVLERMSAPLLDELLGIDTSGARLRQLEDSGNAFLVPLDAERRWYRYHHLFGELLQARLREDEPRSFIELHRRASALLERVDDVDGAIEHALIAGDLERAADLVLADAAQLALGGRASILARRLDRLGPATIDAVPAAALANGWLAVSVADVAAVQRATGAAIAADDGSTLADGATTVAVAVSALRAIAGPDGLSGILVDTSTVLADGTDAMQPWRGVAMMIRGTALSALGQIDEARRNLFAGRPWVSTIPTFAAGLEAHLALLHIYEDDDAGARRHIELARSIRRHHDLEAVPTATVVFAVDALVSARAGDRLNAIREATIGATLVSRLDGVAPRAALLCHVLLARTALLLADRTLAQEHVRGADRARRDEPLGIQINGQLDDIHAQLAAESGLIAGGPALTAAELRVLPYLATHLSLKEIADQLIISRNTAKSHAMSIYRKLGATSRSEAVERAATLGLLTA